MRAGPKCPPAESPINGCEQALDGKAPRADTQTTASSSAGPAPGHTATASGEATTKASAAPAHTPEGKLVPPDRAWGGRIVRDTAPTVPGGRKTEKAASSGAAAGASAQVEAPAPSATHPTSRASSLLKPRGSDARSTCDPACTEGGQASFRLAPTPREELVGSPADTSAV